MSGFDEGYDSDTTVQDLSWQWLVAEHQRRRDIIDLTMDEEDLPGIETVLAAQYATQVVEDGNVVEERTVLPSHAELEFNRFDISAGCASIGDDVEQEMEISEDPDFANTAVDSWLYVCYICRRLTDLTSMRPPCFVCRQGICNPCWQEWFGMYGNRDEPMTCPCCLEPIDM